MSMSSPSFETKPLLVRTPGFSTVELMTALACFGVIAAGACSTVAFAFQSYRSFMRAVEREQALTAADFALSRLTQDALFFAPVETLFFSNDGRIAAEDGTLHQVHRRQFSRRPKNGSCVIKGLRLDTQSILSVLRSQDGEIQPGSWCGGELKERPDFWLGLGSFGADAVTGRVRAMKSAAKCPGRFAYHGAMRKERAGPLYWTVGTPAREQTILSLVGIKDAGALFIDNSGALRMLSLMTSSNEAVADGFDRMECKRIGSDLILIRIFSAPGCKYRCSSAHLLPVNASDPYEYLSLLN